MIRPDHLTLLFLTIIHTAVAVAQSESAQTRLVETPVTRLQPQAINNEQGWQVWGLTESDWTRYRQLKSSPRAYLTPHLTPLQLLGIQAQSTSEQARLARLHAEMTLRRDYQDLLWQARVSQEREKLKNLEQSLWASVQEIGQTLPGSNTSQYLATPDRVLAFVTLDCFAQCIELVAKANQRTASTLFYIVGATQDDQLRAWATRHALPFNSFETGKFALHHAGDFLKRHGHTANTLPLLLRQSGDHYVSITP